MWSQMKNISTYICIHVISDASERFINMCRYREIFLWDIIKTDDGFEAKLTKEDFYSMRDICRKTKSRVKIIKKNGVPFLLFKYRKHYSFVLGICISCVLIYVCSLFVWNISFTGNSEYTDSMLLKYLNGNGVYSGMKIKELNCDDIEQSMRSDFDNITWVSAQISGTRLIVHIKESEGSPVYSCADKEDSDIIAAKDGIVRSIITRKGTPLVKTGDSVVKGQVLVSGTVDIVNDGGEVTGRLYTDSDADILIETDIEYSDRLDIVHQNKNYTGSTCEKGILGVVNTNVELSIPVRNFENADVVSEIKECSLTESFYLPFYYGRKIYYEYQIVEQQYSETEATEILSNKLSQYIKKLLENDVQIIDYDVKIKSNSVSYMADGVIKVLMPAVESVPVIEGDVSEVETAK